MSTSNKIIMQRKSNLDVLKGIAIIMVIITHFSWGALERLKYLFPLWLDMAVPIFMSITGFVYSKSYIKQGVDSFKNAYNYKIILKRFLRYTIPYIYIYIVEIFIKYKQGIILQKNQIIEGFIRGGDGPGGYYYPIMLQIVLLFPIIFFIIKRFNYSGLIMCWLSNFTFEIIHAVIGMDGSTYRLLAFRYMFIVAFGCFLAISPKKIKLSYWVCLSIIGFGFTVITQYGHYTTVILYDWTTTCLVSVMMIFPFMAYYINKSFNCWPLEIIGISSYNIFLIQKIYYCIPIWSKYGQNIGRAYKLIINIMICVLLGIMFYYIETYTKGIVKKIVNSK